MREIVQFFSQVFERIVKNYHLLDNLCACGMNTWEKAGRRITDEPYKGTTNEEEEEEEEGHRLVVQDNPWRWKRWALVSSLDWARLASVDPFNQEKRERERIFCRLTLYIPDAPLNFNAPHFPPLPGRSWRVVFEETNDGKLCDPVRRMEKREGKESYCVELLYFLRCLSLA